MESAYEEYKNLYMKSSADGGVRGKAHDELIQAVMKVNDQYCEYQSVLHSFVYEAGDIVKVKDPNFGALFVEGVVISASGYQIEVHVDNEEPQEDVASPNDHNQEDFCTFDVRDGDVHKVKSWDTLEVGDRVRVKEGCLAFQGIVQAISDDGTEVTVHFSNENDEHGIHDEGHDEHNEDSDDELEEDHTEVYPRELVEKIDTGRIARLRFKDTVRRVQTSIYVASAFKFAVVNSPRSPDSTAEGSSPRMNFLNSERECDEEHKESLRHHEGKEEKQRNHDEDDAEN
mmetsp:Transcript_12972/g.21207  ORF Transcript_12972/g.21207 Transcript_12972/m.21207 type:complete len:286 (+) Transcript_12972:1-858(+)